MAKNTVHDDLKSVDPDKAQKLVGSILELNRMGRPRSNQELRERIDQYFAFCESHKLRPGIESLCTSLHITRTTLFQWKNGRDCDKERTEIIQQAINIIHTFLEQAGLQGLINPASFIFLAKNWLGYKDSISVEENLPLKDDGRRFNALEAAEVLGISLSRDDIKEEDFMP